MPQQILEILLNVKFRFGKRPNDELYQIFLQKIKSFVSKEVPIGIIIGDGPAKNRNSYLPNIAEWSEFFAIQQLIRLNDQIKYIYKPGITIKYYSDDEFVWRVNNVPKKITQQYISSKQKLLDALDIKFITIHKYSVLYKQYKLDKFLDQAEKEIIKWEKDPQNIPRVKKQIVEAKRNLISREMSITATALKKAAHLYRVFRRAEVLAGMHSGPELVAFYSDYLGYLHLWSLKKGERTQPWQGEGVLLRLSSGLLVPTVLTQARKTVYFWEKEVSIKRILGVPKLPQFETIKQFKQSVS